MARKIPSITERLSRYLDSQSQWRFEEARDHPADNRSARSAQKLAEFAFYVADLPADDPRLVRLRLMQDPYDENVFVTSGDVSRFVARIGFDTDTYEKSPDVLLDILVEIV